MRSALTAALAIFAAFCSCAAHPPSTGLGSAAVQAGESLGVAPLADASRSPVGQAELAAPADATAAALSADDGSGALAAIATPDPAQRPESNGAPDAAAALQATGGASSSDRELSITDEPPYLPGRRPRAAGAVAASHEDARIAQWNRGGFDPELPTVVGRNGKTHPLHAAPRVEIDVTAANRRPAGEGADLEKQVRSRGYWPVRLCYESGLRRAQSLKGSVAFRFDLDRNGKISRVQTTDKGLADAEVTACIARALGGLSVSPGQKRQTVRMGATIELYPGDEPIYVRSGAVRTADPAAAAAEEPALGRLHDALRALRPRLASCFRDGLARHGALWGRLAAELTIDERGTIADATEIESRFPDPDVTRCVLDALRGARVPVSSPPTPRVVYALRLGSLPQR